MKPPVLISKRDIAAARVFYQTRRLLPIILSLTACFFSPLALSSNPECLYEHLVDAQAKYLNTDQSAQIVEKLDQQVLDLVEGIQAIHTQIRNIELSRTKKREKVLKVRELKAIREALKADLDIAIKGLDAAVGSELLTTGETKLLELSEEAKASDEAAYYINPINGAVVHRGTLRSLTPEIRKRRTLVISEDGKFLFEGKRFTSGSKHKIPAPGIPGYTERLFEEPMNYVLLENGDIVVGSEHHSQLAGDSRVLCAGQLECKDGTLGLLTEDSGHYLPPPSSLLRMVNALKFRNVDLTQVRLQIRYVQTSVP